MANQLASSNSPYLLQHAHNPVDWYPWGPEALERARREDKPIFLSIGYAACHWCHVMAHESFEDPATAALMNEHFVNIKVDREERPDLDSIYMNAVVAISGQGGWPMSVFLTPEGEPFYGGTYFPPVNRYNMPSFRDVLLSVAEAWRDERDKVRASGKDLAQRLKAAEGFSNLGSQAGSVSKKTIEDASMRLAQNYDWRYGGWGKAPKFPQPMAIEFLLLQATRGDSMALQMATHALDAMAKGGMYDVVGGGFARYSTDDRWLVPHFEKMLYDNAQLARVYLIAHLLTGEQRYRRVCEETLDFLCREMLAQPEDGLGQQGGFYSSLDADSEGEEGKFYVWSLEEIRRRITDPEEAEFFLAAYGVTEGGNFEGHTVLQRALDDKALAERFSLSPQEVPDRLSRLHATLLEAREQRIRPGTDDKVLTAWNGLALQAFAEAARYLQRDDYLEVARLNADFLLTELNPHERLLRSWRAGRAMHNAYLEDYASLILGLLALYATDPDPWWFQSALQLGEEMLAHYRDPQGGFFDTRDDQESLITRPKSIEDNAVPSGNALAAQALLELSAYTGRGDLRDVAEEMLGRVQEIALKYPTHFAKWLCAVDFALGPTQEVALIGDSEEAHAHALVRQVWARYRPRLVVAASPFPPPENAPPLLQDRPQVGGQATAYVCQNLVCLQPTTSPEELEAQLARK